MMMMRRKPYLFLAIVLVLFLVVVPTMVPRLVVAMTSLSEVYHLCTGANYTAGSAFATNLADLFSQLKTASAVAAYHNASSTSNGNSSSSVYGIFQCRGDVTSSDCASCVPVVVQVALDRCPNSMVARVMLDSCYLRYNTTPSFYTTSSPSINRTIWLYNTENNTDPAFNRSVARALASVAASAPLNGGFAVDQEDLNVFALAQCFGYVPTVVCAACLSQYTDAAKHCPNSIGVQFHYDSCYYRYEKGIFYTPPSPPLASPASSETPSLLPAPSSAQSHKSSNTGLIAGLAAAATFVVLSAGLVLCLCLRFRRKAKQTGIQAGGSDDKKLAALQHSATVFSYSELKDATRDFAEENKLGEGGFGPVFKGTLLRDWEEVAIKKLSLASHQGNREFINEVSIITSVQHRNLIKLLGCCVEGSEKLLVYEYLSNKSLDQHLFNSEKNEVLLDWEIRFGIILGTAHGLAYLHHDSQVRIIHRDIKPSNILLADDLTPKIADFGLARLIADDMSHVTTRVAGTMGYLAPEYAMHGKLTEKADVFSFGMLMLEVVSGRKNTDTTKAPDKQHLLEWAWRAFREGRQMEVVDENLGGKFSAEEAIRVVHIALLCTQAQPNLRPTMSHVAHLLGGQSEILDRPEPPPFINTATSLPDLYSSSTSSSSSSSSSCAHGEWRSGGQPVVALSQVDENSTTISLIEAR